MLILILLVNTAVYFLFYKTAVDSELEQLADQTEAMTSALADNPDISKQEIRNLVTAYLPADGMIRIIQDNEEDPYLLVQSRSGEYLSLEGEFSEVEKKEVLSDGDGSDVAVVSKPAIWTDGQVVTIEVTNHLIYLEETMRTLFYVLLIASAILLIPTFTGGVLLGRFLLTPIQKLIRIMKENTRQAQWKKIDVTNRSKDELYEMEKTFNEMIDHLRESFERQEIFVSDASHELKTPIQIIKSYAQLLERRGMANPEIFKESVEAIDMETDRMKRLVEQLLALAKNTQDRQVEAIDFHQLTEEVISTFRRAYGREIDFRSEAESAVVNGNRNQLEQVLYILMENAMKYSSEPVTVSLVERTGDIQVAIRDQGEGIHEEELGRIFDRFYRVDKSRNRETGGTGLGLAIAKSLAEQHGGRITVASKPNEGSEFTVHLPAGR